MYSIKIKGRKFDKFNNLNISYSIDSICSQFSFDVRFEDVDADLFKPLQYQDVELYDDDKMVLAGTFINYGFISNSETNVIGISGYSRAGILEDITVPMELYPLQSNGKSLNEIVSRIFNHLKIKFIIDESVQKEMNIPFKKSIAAERETVKDYICKLANQRNIVVSHDINGNVLFFRPKGNKNPRVLLTKDNCIYMNLQVDGQSMFYSTSIHRQPAMPRGRKKKGENPKKPLLKYEDTSVNILVGDNRRVNTNIMSSGEDVDTRLASQNALADQYKNISLEIRQEGKCLYNIGDIVEVQNSEVFLHKKNKWIIAGITKYVDGESETYTLNLNIPETFTGDKLVNNIFDI